MAPTDHQALATELSDKIRHDLVKRASSDCGDIWIDGDAFLGVATVALVTAAFLLNQAITMNGKRKKRSTGPNWDDLIMLGTREMTIY